MKIISNIDLDIVDQAEEEAFQILLKQRLSFNDRWYSRPSVIKAIPVLRFLGLSLSIIGAAITIIAITVNPGWCPSGLQSGVLILFFILAGTLFYFFPSVDRIMKNWVKNMSTKGSKKLARKCVKAARNAAPFQAEYEIKGDLITYYRGHDDDWKLAWSRKLKGVAIHGKSTTIFFRKRTSIQPIMVLLHDDFDTFEKVLTDLNIDISPIS